LKEVKYENIWKHVHNWESHYFIYRLGDGIIIIQLFTIKYA
jgi:hypothetical protein